MSAKRVIFFNHEGAEVYATDMHTLPRAGEVINVRHGNALPRNLRLSGKVSFVAHNLTENDKLEAGHTVHIYLEPSP